MPSSAPAGMYSGTVVVGVSNGQTLQVPVFASVAMHDPNTALGNPSGPQGRIASGGDVYAKFDTVWPFVPGTGRDRRRLRLVRVPGRARRAPHRGALQRLRRGSGDETYDLYLYDSSFDLLATSHPFVADGVTDVLANNARGPTPAAAPQVLTLTAPAEGRYYVGVSRAKVGGGQRRRLRRVRPHARRGRRWGGGGGQCASQADADSDGLTDANELLFNTLVNLATPTSTASRTETTTPTGTARTTRTRTTTTSARPGLGRRR